MKTEKEKLQTKTVDQLKRYAKKVGAKIVTPEGKAKTKDQLVNSIVMKQRLGGLGERQTGVTNKYVDIKRKAKAPGKRTSASGKTYTERRANRSDKPGQMLGAQNYSDLPDLRVFTLKSIYDGERIAITDLHKGERVAIRKTNRSIIQSAVQYLNERGIKLIGGQSDYLVTKDMKKSIA